MQEMAKATSSQKLLGGATSKLSRSLLRMKAALKQNQLMRIAWQQYGHLARIGRQVAGTDAGIVSRYLAGQQTGKLHLGCGDHAIAGWLNSDLSPRSRNVIVVDVRKKFPFDDETFDYVFSEHTIEHIPYLHGYHMLRECRRVLKGGGKIRISTPDLSFLVGLYGGTKSTLQESYIRWATEKFISSAPSCEDTFVINNFVRDWGHTFIYDEKTLRFSLENAGFTDIVRCRLNESEDENLRSLENEARLPAGFVRLETFTLEATKQARL